MGFNDDILGFFGPSRASFAATAGVTYYIQVDGGTGEGSISLSWGMLALPANDLFANRSTMAGNSGVWTGMSHGASTEANEPVMDGGGQTIWFQWTPSVSGSASITLFGSDFDTQLAVYWADTGGVKPATSGWNLVVADQNDDWSTGLESRVSFSATAGTTYYVQVGGYQGSGFVNMLWTVPSAPPNDNFANRTVLDGTGLQIKQGWTIGSTAETDEPALAPGFSGHSVWYEWTAKGTASVYFQTLNANFDTELSVYKAGAGGINTGTPGWNLDVVASNEDYEIDSNTLMQSYVTFAATAGVTYYIQVDGYIESGDFMLEWRFWGDVTPNAFSFTSVTGAARSTMQTTSPVTISLIDCPTLITVTNGEYQIDAGSWTNVAGTITSGHSVAVRHTSSANYNTKVTTTLKIGTASAAFSSTTLAAALPTVTALSLHTGPSGGGTAVTLTGTDLTGATAVKFGTTAATNVVVVNSTTITCTTPIHVAGKVDVTVTTPLGTSAITGTGNDFTFALTTYQEDSQLLSFYTAWPRTSSTSYSGGFIKTRNSTGAPLSIRFTGKSISIVAAKGPTYGTMTLKLDGAAAVAIDLHAATAAAKVTVYTSAVLADAAHTVVLDYASGNPAGSLIDLDALVVDGGLTPAYTRYQESSTRIAYASAWTSTTPYSASYSGGYMKTRTSAGALTFTFTGTGFRLVSTKGPDWGKMKITIDAVPLAAGAYPSLYNAGGTLYQQLLYVKTGMPYATHTVTLDYSGQITTGATSAKVNLDALDIYGTLIQAP